jgi:Transmembrane exosortase (Exosortase_EpsH)
MAILIAFILAFAVSAEADVVTSYDVTYYLRGDVSQYHTFYGPGSYEFLWGPNYTAVYLQDGGWQFIGMYGAPALGYPQAALPAAMPSISFPAGTDGAVAVTVVRADEPGLFLDQIRYLAPRWLQVFTAWTVARVTGGRHVDTMIVFSGLWVVVDPQCTGLAKMTYSVLLALCLMSVVKPWRWRLAMLAGAPVVGFAVNIGRIVGLTGGA